jgi:aminopeptidase N
MIADQLDVVDPMAIHTARQFVRADIGARLRAELLAQYQANQTPGEYSPDAASIGKRSLKNLALSYLCAAPDEESIALAQRQFDEAST